MSRSEAANKPEFPGRIAVITMPPAINDDDFHSVDRLLERYGAEKIIHSAWPEDFMGEHDKMMATVAKLAQDREVNTVIISQAVPGTNAAIDKFKETRDDVFIIFASTRETAASAAARANLLLGPNEPGLAAAIVGQARKQGAKVFVHYSFPRHMAQDLLRERREIMHLECLKEGVLFVDAMAMDPADRHGLASAQQFIVENVPKLVAYYGHDTAFFATNCHLQVPLIKAVVNSRAIFPQPCCPSPFHGFPEALGIDTKGGFADLTYLIGEACRIAAEKNMTDRLSTWPVSGSMLFTNAGAEYAIKWIKDEVSRNDFDDRILAQCMNSVIAEAVGEECNVNLTSYSEGDKTYNNYKLVLMGYLDL